MKTVIGKQYCVTCDSACDIVDTATGNTIHTHHAGEVQSYFTAIGLDVEASDDTAVVTEVFKSAPAGNGGGGYIESDLNVGHGAADAVAAVCTLTLGDPTDEGDLKDNAEHELHLDAQPALQSHGVLTVADATEGGTLSIGGEVVENFTEEKETPASISLELLVDVSELHGDYGFGLQYNGELWCTFATYITDITGEAFAEDLGKAEFWKLPDGTALGFAPVEATWDSATEKITMACTAKQGADGDNVAVEDGPKCPFIVPQDAPSFSGGQDARTMEEALAYVEAVVNSYDGLEADVDAENNAVLVTASEPGAAGDLLALGFEGDLLEVTEQMDGGQDARTYADVIAAINGDDGVSAPTYPFGAKAEATETDGTITLTANDAGAAANSIVYTATGCFGGGTVKQGSTTRGKNAVTQTAFKIYLNGEEFTGGSVTVDPAPTQGSGNAVSSGGVYTALAGKQNTLTAGAGITLSGGTVSVNADGAVNATDTKPVSGKTVNAAIAAAVIGAGGAALDGNNTFTATNTFNGAVALNGATTKPASAEVWSADTIMTLGMHQVAAWFDELEADSVFNPQVDDLNENALLKLSGSTNNTAPNPPGVVQFYLHGGADTAASDLLAGRVTMAPRSVTLVCFQGSGTGPYNISGYSDQEHPWLVCAYPGTVSKPKNRSLLFLGGYAAANSCGVVLVSDYGATGYRLVDAYLSAVRGTSGASTADTAIFAVSGIKANNVGREIYMGFRGDTYGGHSSRRLMRRHVLPEFGFGEIGAADAAGYFPNVIGTRGVLADSGSVQIQADLWAYEGTYAPQDPDGATAFFARDASVGLGEGHSNTTGYNAVQLQTFDVYLADVQAEQPSTAPQDYTYSDTPHENKDAVEVPATGGYVLAKIVWGNLGGRYYGDYAVAQAVVLDPWLADTEAGADEDGHVLGSSHSTEWRLSKAETQTFDQWTGSTTCYAYIKVPPNTTGAERDGYAVVGITGLRAGILHIVQAAS